MTGLVEGRIESFINSLVTDRTQSDVDNRSRKAFYMTEDLNRVESAVSILSAMLVDLPEEMARYAASKNVAWSSIYDVTYNPNDFASILVKTDWTKNDIPYAVDAERYLGNVFKLSEALPYSTDTLPESLNRLTWYGANAIEKALQGLYYAIQGERNRIVKLIDSTGIDCYSGEYYSNEFPFVTADAT